MAETQSSLDLERHRDLKGRGSGPWARRAVLAVFAAIAIAALAGAIGQRGGRDAAAGPAAKLEVAGPSRVRGGLYFQALITVRARRSIEHPQLVLNRSWFDGLTINTMEPQASQESATGDGNLAFQYDKLDAGDVMRVWIEYQVNPTTVTRWTQVVQLDDGAHRLVSLRRRFTVLP